MSSGLFSSVGGVVLTAVLVLGAAELGGCASFLSGAASGGTGGGDDSSGLGGGWSGAGGSVGFGGGASGGAGGASVPPPGSYAYLCGDGGACTPGTEDCTPGGNPGAGGSGGAAAIACQLVPGKSAAIAVCGEAGAFGLDGPCENASHCSAGLGCVKAQSGGICRPYCCGDVEECPANTYCTPVFMAEAAMKVQIPVCKPVKKCKLLDDTSCDAAQTCTIVRDDGTTSCVDLGVGMVGEMCPCAAGHVCSKITNRCLKLCHIGNDPIDCPAGGTCQGGVMGYPDGIGVCVGYNM